MFQKKILVCLILCCQYSVWADFIFDKKYGHDDNKQYILHLQDIEKVYLDTENIIKLNSNEVKYTEEIVGKIQRNNQQLFKSKKLFKINFINREENLLFSLPGGSIFISKGLMDKYLKNEHLLAVVVAREMIKISQDLYNKLFYIPTGFRDFNDVVRINKLPIKEESILDKWSYIILERSGFDPNSILNWLQVQNKNSFDFIYILDSFQLALKKEQLFKNFMSTKSNTDNFEQAALQTTKQYYLLREKIIRTKNAK